MKIANYSDKLPMPPSISSKARDFMMCCLRKSPFHRKNVTKLLKHPFVKLESFSKMDKSFDDVSALNFDESPKSPRKLQEKELPFNVLQELEKPGKKQDKFFNESQISYKEDLLNILKKIEKQKREESIQTPYSPQTKSKRRSIPARTQEKHSYLHERKRSTNLPDVKDSSDINFVLDKSFGRPSKLLPEELVENGEQSVPMNFYKKDKPSMIVKSSHNKRDNIKYTRNVSIGSRKISEEEASDISSSEFI